MNNVQLKIRSRYILKEISEHLNQKKLLQIIRYNKQLRRRLEKRLEDYRKAYSKTIIEIEPVENICGKIINYININKSYYHIYFNDSKEEINRNIITQEDKVHKIKIIIDYEIKSFYNLFHKIKTLKKVNFIKFTNNDIYNMSRMFYNCSSLEEINFSNFNTDKVKDMSNMFRECSSLKKLNLNKFNTTNVTNMCGMFYGCSSLENLNLSAFNIKKVSDMSGMFYNCSSLKELNLLNFKNTDKTILEFIFVGCSSLKELKCEEKPLNIEYERLNNNFYGIKFFVGKK